MAIKELSEIYTKSLCKLTDDLGFKNQVMSNEDYLKHRGKIEILAGKFHKVERYIKDLEKRLKLKLIKH